MADYVGQQFGNYRLIQSLGSGGFAEVYLAEHRQLPVLCGQGMLARYKPIKSSSSELTLFSRDVRNRLRFPLSTKHSLTVIVAQPSKMWNGLAGLYASVGSVHRSM